MWIVPVTINGARRARFLLDTWASVTLVAPALAESLGMPPAAPDGRNLQLQTVAGLTAGRIVKIPTLRVGDVEITDTTAVVHDPGPGVDGILGNSFLGRFLVTIDADRKTLALIPLPSR